MGLYGSILKTFFTSINYCSLDCKWNTFLLTIRSIQPFIYICQNVEIVILWPWIIYMKEHFKPCSKKTVHSPEKGLAFSFITWYPLKINLLLLFNQSHYHVGKGIKWTDHGNFSSRGTWGSDFMQSCQWHYKHNHEGREGHKEC